MVGVPWASTRNSSSPISASSRPAKRSMSEGCGEVAKRELVFARDAVDGTHTFSRMTGGAERSVIRTSVSGSGVGLSIASRSTNRDIVLCRREVDPACGRRTAGSQPAVLPVPIGRVDAVVDVGQVFPPVPLHRSAGKVDRNAASRQSKAEQLGLPPESEERPSNCRPGLYPRGRQALYQLNYEAAYVRSIRNRHRGPWPWNPPPRIRE